MTSGIRHKYKYQKAIDKINRNLFIVNNKHSVAIELISVNLNEFLNRSFTNNMLLVVCHCLERGFKIIQWLRYK